MSRLGGAGAVAQLVADIPLSVVVLTISIDFTFMFRRHKLCLVIISLANLKRAIYFRNKKNIKVHTFRAVIFHVPSETSDIT
jgi:hypothetical protein